MLNFIIGAILGAGTMFAILVLCNISSDKIYTQEEYDAALKKNV